MEDKFLKIRQEFATSVGFENLYDFVDHFSLFAGIHTIGNKMFTYELLKNAVGVPGDVVEFGCWKGSNLMFLAKMMTLLEPNSPKRVIGFDNFSGLPSPTSTDGDFAQLISANVSQYNGVGDLHITHQGTFDAKGKPVKDKKTGEPKAAQDPEWMLFEKCMRGDTSDNVFSAYPGVRTKGSKNKVGLTEAFEDRKSRGYAWNNLMLQRWSDHNGVEHRVLEDYQRNIQLCDLTAQPAEIKQKIVETIRINAVPKTIDQVGIRMLKFCNAWDMKKISDNIQTYAEPFQARYQGTIQNEM